MRHNSTYDSQPERGLGKLLRYRVPDDRPSDSSSHLSLGAAVPGGNLDGAVMVAARHFGFGLHGISLDHFGHLQENKHGLGFFLAALL